jgi:hypothetical protein
MENSKYCSLQWLCECLCQYLGNLSGVGRCSCRSWKLSATRHTAGKCYVTPKNRDALEKLRAAQWIKIFPTFYGTYRFVTVFARIRHWKYCRTKNKSGYVIKYQGKLYNVGLEVQQMPAYDHRQKDVDWQAMKDMEGGNSWFWFI